MKCCVCFVSYNEYDDYNYTKLFITSFIKVFKKELDIFAVDNNYETKKNEIKFLIKNNVKIIKNQTNDKSHGKGLDLAVEHVSQLGYDSVIFLEPDCFISNRIWYNQLLEALNQGYHMASCVWHDAGWLHVCGSIWLIEKIPGSFKSCKMRFEEIHNPNFQKLNLPEFMSTPSNRLLWYFYFYHWDVGVRNYFLIDEDKRKLTSWVGFNHLWQSHKTTFLNRIKNKKEFLKIGKFYLNNVNKIL